MLDSRNLTGSSIMMSSTRQIINAQSTSPCTPIGVLPASGLIDRGYVSALSGALTASTPKVMISISGSAGEMPYLQVGTIDTTTRTVRIRVTVDGRSSPYAFDSTAVSIAPSSYGIIVAGNSSSVNISPWSTPIKWTNSLVVEIFSSLTETDKLYIGYRYNLEQ